MGLQEGVTVKRVYRGYELQVSRELFNGIRMLFWYISSPWAMVIDSGLAGPDVTKSGQMRLLKQRVDLEFHSHPRSRWSSALNRFAPATPPMFAEVLS